jgi:hypothetical protein
MVCFSLIHALALRINIFKRFLIAAWLIKSRICPLNVDTLVGAAAPKRADQPARVNVAHQSRYIATSFQEKLHARR